MVQFGDHPPASVSPFVECGFSAPISEAEDLENREPGGLRVERSRGLCGESVGVKSLPQTALGCGCYSPHFTGKETEAQKSEVTSVRSHNLETTGICALMSLKLELIQNSQHKIVSRE